MKKDVILSISSTQHFEGSEEEQIDLMTEAKLYERGGKYYICYEETEITGLGGTRTTVKMDDNMVSMIRTGAYPSELLFAKDQRHVGLYETDYGALTISTHTHKLDNTIGEDGGELSIEYTIEVDNSLVGQHRFRMVVAPTQGEEQ